MRFMLAFSIFFLAALPAYADLLEVKPGRSAIVKDSPSGDGNPIGNRLPAGTQVQSVGEAPRYYYIELPGGTFGWSYKGNFTVISPGPIPPLNAQTLQFRTDVLRIIVLDVEVGDATLIICPLENGRQDVILIDTGENDGDRIRAELIANGFVLSDRPISRFIITHYDKDHFGAAADIVPISGVVYDHGDNIKRRFRRSYRRLVNTPAVDRRTMDLNYHETFSGGVEIECVAVNQATDFDPHAAPSPPSEDNENSIALIISYGGFDYFTGGDLTFSAERSLAGGIRNCDVYHVNHHGSRATSSMPDFVTRLDPEVSVVSNGTRHGHPTADVAQRLIGLGSRFYQTNFNPDTRAQNHAGTAATRKFVADDTFHSDSDDENAEGALGTIKIVVDAAADHYYVLMDGLPLAEATFPIEH